MRFCALSLVVLSVFCGSLWAVSDDFAICNSSDDQEMPALSEHFAVWMDGRGGIYGKNLEDGQEFALSPNGNIQKNPAIDGKIVVWQENDDIIGYDLENQQRFDICVDPNTQQYPRISGDIVVWQEYISGNFKIFWCDINVLQKNEINPDGINKLRPDIDGDTIVWGQGGYGEDIYGKNIVTGEDFEICTAAGQQYQPRISGNLVVWVDKRNSSVSDSDIYGRYLDENDDFAICDVSGTQNSPDVDNETVIWKDKRNGSNYLIYCCDVSVPGFTSYALNSGSFDYSSPAVDNYTAIWALDENFAADIWGCYLDAFNSVDVTKPSGGDFMSAGSIGSVNWQTSPLGQGVVKIEFSSDGGANYELITANAYNDGVYELSVPDSVESQDCYIRVSDAADAGVFAVSQQFAVAGCSEELTADMNGDCEVDLADYGIFAGQWLGCGNPFDQNCLY